MVSYLARVSYADLMLVAPTDSLQSNEQPQVKKKNSSTFHMGMLSAEFPDRYPFVERRKIWKEMERIIPLGESDKVTIIALHGPSGSGKTRLVNRFIHQYWEKYTSCFLATARSDTELELCWRRLSDRVTRNTTARSVDRSEEKTALDAVNRDEPIVPAEQDSDGLVDDFEIKQAANAGPMQLPPFIDWLNEDGNNGWILFIDDVSPSSLRPREDSVVGVRPLLLNHLGSLRQGTVVLTTNHPGDFDVDCAISSIKVHAFEPAESRQLLEMRLSNSSDNEVFELEGI